MEISQQKRINIGYQIWENFREIIQEAYDLSDEQMYMANPTTSTAEKFYLLKQTDTMLLLSEMMREFANDFIDEDKIFVRDGELFTKQICEEKLTPHAITKAEL